MVLFTWYWWRVQESTEVKVGGIKSLSIRLSAHEEIQRLDQNWLTSFFVNTWAIFYWRNCACDVLQFELVVACLQVVYLHSCFILGDMQCIPHVLSSWSLHSTPIKIQQFKVEIEFIPIALNLEAEFSISLLREMFAHLVVLWHWLDPVACETKEPQ